MVLLLLFRHTFATQALRRFTFQYGVTITIEINITQEAYKEFTFQYGVTITEI